ncbi:MAG: DUF2493 domain-containing protein [Pseudomonas sp.]
MRVLFCGGRGYDDELMVLTVMLSLHEKTPITCVIHGGARGADTLAGETALALGIPIEVYLPDWARYGSAAGFARNRRMIIEGKPDLVVAFPGGRGTLNMRSLAVAYGVDLIDLHHDVPLSARHHLL